MNTILLTLILVVSVVLDAIGDGLNDNGDKKKGHLINALSIGSLLSIPLLGSISLIDAPVYIIGYVLVRFGLFDITYNSIRKLPLGYVGKTSYLDLLWSKFKPPGFLKVITEVLALIVGTLILIRI